MYFPFFYSRAFLDYIFQTLFSSESPLAKKGVRRRGGPRETLRETAAARGTQPIKETPFDLAKPPISVCLTHPTPSLLHNLTRLRHQRLQDRKCSPLRF